MLFPVILCARDENILACNKNRITSVVLVHVKQASFAFSLNEHVFRTEELQNKQEMIFTLLHLLRSPDVEMDVHFEVNMKMKRDRDREHQSFMGKLTQIGENRIIDSAERHLAPKGRHDRIVKSKSSRHESRHHHHHFRHSHRDRSHRRSSSHHCQDGTDSSSYSSSSRSPTPSKSHNVSSEHKRKKSPKTRHHSHH